MTRKATLTILLCAFITACASVPMASKSRDLELKLFSSVQDRAAVYIYSGLLGTGASYDVFLNGKYLGANTQGTYLYKELTPGEHTFTAPLFSKGGEISMTAEAGKLYFIKQTIFFPNGPTSWGQMSLVLETETNGKLRVLDSKLAQTQH